MSLNSSVPSDRGQHLTHLPHKNVMRIIKPESKQKTGVKFEAAHPLLPLPSWEDWSPCADPASRAAHSLSEFFQINNKLAVNGFWITWDH